MVRALTIVALVGCKVLPPPPVLPPHAATAVDERGATTATIVFGMAGQMFGGEGWGVALRVEHQQTAQTTLGVELTGGRGSQGQDANHALFRHWMVATRAYGRFATESDGPLALTYGVGLTGTSSGLLAGTLHAGVAIAPDTEHAIPVAAVGLALVVPLRAGHAYREEPTNITFGPPEPGLPRSLREETPYVVPKTELYLGFDLGLLVRVGDTRNVLSGDLGVAFTLREHEMLYALTVADSQHFK